MTYQNWIFEVIGDLLKKSHCFQLHLFDYACLECAEKVILKAEAYCWAWATGSWPEQDNWCAPHSAQMNKHWQGYWRKFRKESWGSKRSSSDQEPDTKAPRAGWSEDWLLTFQRVKASTGQICSNFGKSRRQLLHMLIPLITICQQITRVIASQGLDPTKSLREQEKSRIKAVVSKVCTALCLRAMAKYMPLGRNKCPRYEALPWLLASFHNH